MQSKARKIIRLVWNGPFHVGPLSSPVSLGDALLKILQTVWRAAVLLTAILLLLLTIVLGAIAWEDHLKERVFPPLAASVSVEVRHYSDPDIPVLLENPDGTANLAMPCMKEYPLSVSFYNGSDEPLSRIFFAIRGYVPGRTSNVLIAADELEADALILPGRKWQTCYSAQTDDQIDLDGLVYDADVVRVEQADPAMAMSAPPPFIVHQPDDEGSSGTDPSLAQQIWEFIQSVFVIALGIVLISYAAYCISAVASWVTRGKVSPAQNFSAAFPWAYIVVISLGMVLLSGLGSAPPWMEWATQKILDGGSALGLDPDWTAGLAVGVVMFSPILVPITLHVFLRLIGASIAPLQPFKETPTDNKSEGNSTRGDDPIGGSL